MAGEQSPGDVSERAMFAAPDVAPAARPPVPAVFGKPAESLRASPQPSRGLPPLPSWAGIAAASLRWLAKATPAALATEADRGVGFIFIPVFLGVGAISYFSLAREPGLAALGAISLLFAALAFVARERPLARAAFLAALLFSIGMLAAKLETLRAGTKVLGSEITTRLTGNVVQIEHRASGRVRLTIDVTATERPVLRYAPDRVRVSARKIPDGIEAGSSVTGLVRLMPPSGPVRPQSYDFSFNSYFDGIGASGFYMRGPEQSAYAPRAVPAAALFRASVERARSAVAERIRSRITGAEGEIAAALVVGIRAGIPEDVNEALRRAGLYHVISISGLHMALVAGTIMGLLRGAFALFPDFSSRRPVKKYSAVAALAGLAGYLFFSGADVAAQRSFIMLAVMLTALLFDRAALTMRNLAISAIVVIIVSPHETAGPSFQMSFAATAALVGAYAGWSDYRANRPLAPPPRRSLAHSALRKLVVFAAGLAATSLIAGGATSVFSAYHFQQVSSLGLLANLSAMPIVSIVVMPFAVLGALAMPFGVDGPFFDIMGKGLTLTIAIARWFSERSPLDTVGLIPPLAVVFLTIALLIATACTTWLRAAALPIALTGLLMLPQEPTPHLLLSEDGRLLGLALGDGRIAVNRARPNDFTTDNWKRALQAETVVKPDIHKKPKTAKAESVPPEGTKAAAAPEKLLVKDIAHPPMSGPPAPEAETMPPAAHPSAIEAAHGPAIEALLAAWGAQAHSPSGARTHPPADRPNAASRMEKRTSAEIVAASPASHFICEDGFCLARHPSGAIVAHAADAVTASRACDYASVIIVDDATAEDVCPLTNTLVVTKRDLARRGSAQIAFEAESAPADRSNPAASVLRRFAAAIAYAIAEPYRPWHTQRQFSREARGMPPYRRKKRTASPANP